MLVSELITKINYAIRGIDDVAPSAGTEEYNYWLDRANAKKDEIYEDISKQWRFSFKPVAPNEVGTVTTAASTALVGVGTFFTDYKAGDTIIVNGETVRTISTITDDTNLTVTVAFSTTAASLTFTRQIIIDFNVESYNLHRRFLAPSDRIIITKTDGTKSYVTYEQPQETDLTRKAYISGTNPMLLTFTTDIKSTEDIEGGTLSVPGYFNVADLSEATQLIPLPDPNWIVLATAADIAFSDIIYEDKTEGLNVRANNLFTQMVKNNRRGTFGNPRRLATAVPKLHGPERR